MPSSTLNAKGDGEMNGQCLHHEIPRDGDRQARACAHIRTQFYSNAVEESCRRDVSQGLHLAGESDERSLE